MAEVKTKFTPGPWRARTNDDCKPLNVADYSIDSSTWLVAEVYSDIPEEESKANAQLIAAAPDMFEALTGLLAARDSVTMGLEKELYAEWVPKARAALFKATTLQNTEVHSG